MHLIIKIIGIVFVLLAILFFSKPDIMKTLMHFFKRSNRIYLAAAARLILATIFLTAARECNITWIITSFGLLFILSALLIIILGPAKTRPILEWYEKQPVGLLQILAILLLVIGAVIIYAA